MIPAVLAQYESVLEAFETTRLGAHATQPVPIVSLPSGRAAKEIVGMDALLQATARLTLSTRRSILLVSYSPMLAATDLELGLHPALLHSGNLAITWNDRFLRVMLSETASYGQISTAVPLPSTTQPLASTSASSPSGAAPTQAAPPAPATGPAATAPSTLVASAPQTIGFGSSNTFGGVYFGAGGRTAAFVSGGYTTSGGLTTVYHTILPEQHGPYVDAWIMHAASRRDSLTTSFDARDTRTVRPCTQAAASPPPAALCSEEQDAPIAQVLETYRHRFSGVATASFGIGASATVVQTTAVDEIVVQPVAELTASETFGPARANVATLTSTVGPMVDLYTGYPSYRFQALAALTNRYAPGSTVGVTLGAVKSINFPIEDPAPIAAVNAGVEMKIRIDLQIDLGLTLQEFWQRQLVPLTQTSASFASTLGFATLTARAPVERF